MIGTFFSLCDQRLIVATQRQSLRQNVPNKLEASDPPYFLVFSLLCCYAISCSAQQQPSHG